MSRDPKPLLTLADVLREKITEKHTEIQTQFSDNGSKYITRRLDQPFSNRWLQVVRVIMAVFGRIACEEIYRNNSKLHSSNSLIT